MTKCSMNLHVILTHGPWSLRHPEPVGEHTMLDQCHDYSLCLPWWTLIILLLPQIELILLSFFMPPTHNKEHESSGLWLLFLPCSNTYVFSSQVLVRSLSLPLLWSRSSDHSHSTLAQKSSQLTSWPPGWTPSEHFPTLSPGNMLFLLPLKSSFPTLPFRPQYNFSRSAPHHLSLLGSQKAVGLSSQKPCTFILPLLLRSEYHI